MLGRSEMVGSRVVTGISLTLGDIDGPLLCEGFAVEVGSELG